MYTQTIANFIAIMALASACHKATTSLGFCTRAYVYTCMPAVASVQRLPISCHRVSQHNVFDYVQRSWFIWFCRFYTRMLLLFPVHSPLRPCNGLIPFASRQANCPSPPSFPPTPTPCALLYVSHIYISVLDTDGYDCP